MDISSLLLSGLTGAATGYITNDVAVRMLFRSFGPLGGVLESTREEFISNISELVEEEIINSETIAGELKNPRVQQEINRLVSEFISVQLYEQFSDHPWQEVPGWEESCSGVAEMLSDEELLTSVIDGAAKNTRVSDLASSEQISHVIERLLQGSGEVLQNEELRTELANFLLTFLFILYNQEESRRETLGELKQIQDNLQEHRREIRVKLQNILQQLELSRVMEEELISLLEKPLGNWWSVENDADADNYEDINFSLSGLIDLWQEFLQKPEGKELIEDVFVAVFSALQEVDLTLPELLGDNWQEVILPLLRKRLPELLEVLLNWIEENRDDLEKIIDEAIEEVLSAGSGVRNQLKNIIFKALQGNVARRYGILNRVLQNLNSNQDKAKLAQQLTDQLADMLENKTVGWFFYKLEELDIIDWKLFQQLLVRFLSSDKLRELEQDSEVFSLVPADFFAVDDLAQKLSDLLPELISDIMTNILLSEDFASDFNEIIHDLFSQQLKSSRSVSSLQKFLGQFPSYLTSQDNASRLAAGLTPVVANNISSRPLNDFLNPQLKNSAVDYLQTEITTNFKVNICQQKDRKIEYMLQEIQEIPDYQNKLTNFLLNILQDNLSLLLEDQVSEAVSDNLLALSTEDMREVVESFMGRELKPLTYFGGLLGFTAGILMETAGGELLAAAGGSGRLGISMLVYGLVGFITNITAINMIFRPYNSFSLRGLRVPFTPGLIARNQERFAAALGDFIENDLLNPHQMSKLLRDNRSGLEDILKDTLLQDDYRRLRMILRVSSDDFAYNLLEIVKSQFRKSSRKISEFVIENFNRELSLPFIFSLAGDWGQNELEKYNDNIHKIAAELLAELNNIDSNYGRLLPREIISGVNKKEKTENIAEILGLDLKTYWTSIKKSGIGAGLLDGDYEISAEDLLSSYQQKQLTEFLSDGILEFFQNGELAELLQRLDKKLLAGSLPEQLQKIIPSLVQKNLTVILDIFLERIIAFLSRQRDNIKDMAAEVVEKELKSSASQEGFLSNIILKGAYRFTDGRGTLEDLIDNLIDDKLPNYFRNSRESIGRQLEPIVMKVSSEVSQDLLYESSTDQWADLITEIAKKPEVDRNVRRFINRFSSLLWQIQFSPLKSVNWLRNYGNKKMSGVINALEETYKKNDTRVNNIFFDLLLIPGTEIANNISPARSLELITGIKDPEAEDIEKILNNNKNELNSTLADVINCINNCLAEEKFFNREDRKTAILREDILLEDMSWALKNLVDREDFWQELEADVSGYLERVSAQLPRMLEDKTVKYFADKFIDAGMDSLEIHFQSLLESVAVKATAVKQVEEMDPAAIEALFKSFAGRYLNRLKMYGWSGSFFGILAELATIILPG